MAAPHRGSAPPWRKRTPKPLIKSRQDWRGLVELAGRCARDAGETSGPVDAQAADRLIRLSSQINLADTGLFEREAGAATADVARAFVRTARAFTRQATPGELREEIALLVAAEADFLDRALTRLADRDFQRAHAGRPEVWG